MYADLSSRRQYITVRSVVMLCLGARGVWCIVRWYRISMVHKDGARMSQGNIDYLKSGNVMWAVA